MVLAGGIAHPDQVVRIRDTVRRPAGPYTESIFSLLHHLNDVGFDGAPRPLGLDEHGREVLRFVPGDVPIPPLPSWSLEDGALASAARLLRRFHDAARDFNATSHAWSDAMADPRGGSLICHTDVCPENVVFRGNEAVALLDFDFASPGRAVYDVVSIMSMWAPLRPAGMRRPEMRDLDAATRVRIVADAYGLTETERAQVPDVLQDRWGTRFLERRVEAGDPAFVEVWEAQGGAEGNARATAELQTWFSAFRPTLVSVLTG